MKILFALAVIFLAFWLFFVEQQPEPTGNFINNAALGAVGGK